MSASIAGFDKDRTFKTDKTSSSVLGVFGLPLLCSDSTEFDDSGLLHSLMFWFGFMFFSFNGPS